MDNMVLGQGLIVQDFICKEKDFLNLTGSHLGQGNMQTIWSLFLVPVGLSLHRSGSTVDY